MISSNTLPASLYMYVNFMFGIYNRTSMARTLMARLPRLSRTRSSVPMKNLIAAVWDNSGWFSY